jgi:hypothetical protein
MRATRRRLRRRSARFLRDGDKMFLFQLAKDLGKTVKELLTGRPGPLTNSEYHDWYVFYLADIQAKKMARKGK